MGNCLFTIKKNEKIENISDIIKYSTSEKNNNMISSYIPESILYAYPNL